MNLSTNDVADMLSRPMGESASGFDIRKDKDHYISYTTLRDARALARDAERKAQANDESPRDLVKDWGAVCEQASAILSSVSKDLEVAAWLAEAEIRLRGFAGLAAVFAGVADMVERYWPDLYSVDDTDDASRVAPFAGLNGVMSEGSLIQPLRLSPLLPGQSHGRFGLWHWGRAERDPTSEEAKAFADVLAETPVEDLKAHVASVQECLDAFRRLCAAFDEKAGAGAPPASYTRAVLEDAAAAAYRILRGVVGDAPLDGAVADASPDNEGAETPLAPAGSETAAAAVPALAPQPLMTREDAFRELMRIAQFFRRAEPHSPMSYAIETLVRRGRLTLPELLQELVPDDMARAQFLAFSGIRLPGRPEGRGAD